MFIFKNKRYSLLLVSMQLLFSQLLMAQSSPTPAVIPPGKLDSTIHRFARIMDSLDRSYKCKKDSITANAATQAAFDTLFKPILSNVFLGNSDLVQDASASSFTKDPEKGTISINHAQFLDNGRNHLFNLGVFSTSTEGIFGIYTSSAWSSEIGFKVGMSHITSRSRYFKSAQCDSLKSNRQQYFAVLLENYKKILLNDAATLRDDRNNLKAYMDSIMVSGAIGLVAKSQEIVDKTAQLKTKDSLLKLIDSLTPSGNFNDSHYQFYLDKLEKDIGAFEVKNDIYTGYRVWWWSWFAALSNNALSLSTDSLPKELKSAYSPKNIAKFSFGINRNLVSNSEYSLQFLRFGINGALRNYLDHPLVKKPGLRFDTIASTQMLFNRNETSWAKYDDLRANIWTIEPNIYYAYFWKFLKKKFGVDCRAEARIPIHRPEAISTDIYPTTFSLCVGPVFRLNKAEDISKGTVGVEIGIIDGSVNDNVWKYFGARLKIGVPFSALIN